MIAILKRVLPDDDCFSPETKRCKRRNLSLSYHSKDINCSYTTCSGSSCRFMDLKD